MDSHSSIIEKVIHASFGHKALVMMLVVLAVVLGGMAYGRMARNVYPDITIPVFTIVTENEAMASEEIELMITRPLESAMNGLPGVRRIRSQTTQGLSSVVVEFDIETDYWLARQFVTERIAQVTGQLPAGTEPPALSSATTRLAEVYELAIEGDLPLTELREIADWQVRYNLLTVPGVAEVLNMGGFTRQYRVTIDPHRMRAHGVTLSEVEKAIESGNENAAGGFISTGPTEYVVRGIGRFDSVEDIENAVVAERAGAPVYLKHVSSVVEGTAIRRGIARKNGSETVVALVIKQPTADTVQVVKGVEKAIDDMRATLPDGVRLAPYYDQTHLINQSLASVGSAILVGAVLVVIVLLLFLGHFRSTVIVAATLPLSVLIAGLLMNRFGVGLNTMSLGGLAVAVGIMVDASIIMVENIHHRFHRSRGDLQEPKTRERVAHKAAVEVGRPIAFATVIIIAVFLPLFMMGGIEGLLFKPLAATVGAAMLVALLLSLTFTPVLATRFLKRNGVDNEGEVRFVTSIKRAYVPALEYALRHRRVVIAAAVLLVVPTAAGIIAVGKDFMPRLDEGSWFASTITPAQTSLEENDRITQQVERVLLDDPDIMEVIKRNGRSERAIGCVLPVNSGEMFINLRPKSELSRPAEEILADVRKDLESIPGVASAFTQPLQNKIDESLEGTPAPLQVKLFGPDIKVLAAKGDEIRQIVEATAGVADVKMDQPSGIPQLQVRIDREAAARHGVSVADISEVVRLAVGGEEITQVWKDQRSYGVFARFPDSIRNDPESIRGILVDTPSGTAIPLSQLAAVTLAEGPNVIWREATSRRISVDASIQGRDLGGVVADIKHGLERLELPDGYFVVFGGQYQSQQRAMRSLLFATGVALAVVFMLLYTALRSASQAGAILATVPVALFGGVMSLLIAGETINVSSGVGFIALFGIAVQNSLVLFTQIRQYIADGHGREGAVRLASIQRLRPKLMTAGTTALGLVPILISGGVGAEIEKPLAIVMVGGLITSTLFTLIVLPALYLALGRGQAQSDAIA